MKALTLVSASLLLASPFSAHADQAACDAIRAAYVATSSAGA